jgi:benzoate-CoA ligase
MGILSWVHLAQPPPSRFNFAAHLLARNAGRAEKTAYIDDQQRAFVRRACAARGTDGRCAGGTRPSGARSACWCACTTPVDFPVVFLGALHAGVDPVAVNTLLTVDDYAYMIEHSRAQALFVSGALLPTLQQAMARARTRSGT